MVFCKKRYFPLIQIYLLSKDEVFIFYLQGKCSNKMTNKDIAKMKKNNSFLIDILPRAHNLLNCRYLIGISQKQNPTSPYEKWGFVLPPYALPNLGLKATILNHKFFRTFRKNCQEHIV